MTRPHSLELGHPKTPSRSAAELTTTLDPFPSPKVSSPPRSYLSHSFSNRAWISGQQRRSFIHHLEEWSLNHDSSPHFQGAISLPPQAWRNEQHLGFGVSVKCILTDPTFPDARKSIIIRLFPPQENMSLSNKDAYRQSRHDSMDLLDEGTNDLRQELEGCGIRHDHKKQQSKDARNSTTNGYYKLVVRCGAGWVSAREYFSKLYFTHLHARKMKSRFRSSQSLDKCLKQRSQILGPRPLPKETVTVRPLFHMFQQLPPELQDMIFTTAAGLASSYNLCYDGHLCSYRRNQEPSPISLSTMFQISRKMNEHLIPYVYHSTDFHFGLTGFTNFLWQAGPTNRPEIRRLTFHFGKLAMLHCIRWLAPDHVFELLEPPVVTNPRSLQYFWRCQIQDLARELRLLSLKIDVKGIPMADLAMVVRILQSAFGSVERIYFVETDKNGDTKQPSSEVEHLIQHSSTATWRELCTGYWERHKTHPYFFKFELMQLDEETFQSLMDLNKEDFAQ